MAKMIWDKVYRADQIQKKTDDEVAGSFGAMARRTRALLQQNRPDLSPTEIEERMSRIMKNGLKPCSPPPRQNHFVARASNRKRRRR
jgi:hypothetical protein